jgi:uncharacterized coiled-coil protein SlyX
LHSIFNTNTAMKKYFLLGAIALSFAACKHEQTNNETTRERDSLLAIINQRDSALNDFVGSFNDVERSLNEVSAKQNVISKSTEKTGELQPDAKTRINNEIASINNLMDENRKKLAELNKRLKKSGDKNSQLSKMIETLNDQLAQKDKELTDLNEKLAALNAQVTLLQTSVDTLNRTVSEQKTALYTAYYVVGTTKDLQAANIIDRTGGLLGIGKTSKLSSHFDNSKFTRVDYSQMGSIPVSGKNIKLVTTHPAGSYTLDKDKNGIVKNLVITDPHKFWSASKYLVVVKD